MPSFKNVLTYCLLFILFGPLHLIGQQAAKSNSVKNLYAGFIENKGQIYDQNFEPNPAVKYLLSLGNGLNVQLKANSFSYDTYIVERKVPASVKTSAGEKASSFAEASDGKKDEMEMLRHPIDSIDNYEIIYHFHRIDIELINANPNPEIITSNPSPHYQNYYNAVCAEQGASFVSSFQKVIYKNIYSGIDLEFVAFSDTQKAFEYNFIIHPQGDLSKIRMRYNGAYETQLIEGQIKVILDSVSIYESIPKSFLEETDEQLDVSYTSFGNNEFGFQVADYNSSNTLIVDPFPSLLWATYYGGSDEDIAYDVILDSSDVLVVGRTKSSNAIASSGAYQVSIKGNADAFIAKIDSAGQRLWATYFGGSGIECGNDVVIDREGSILIAGSTTSTAQFATSGVHQITYGGGPYDAFVAKFSNSGQRLWATYYGGNLVDWAQGIATDVNNNVIITGYTASKTQISSPGAHDSVHSGWEDAFVAKFDTSGQRLWASYMGGHTSDFGNAVVTDQVGNVYVAGTTRSWYGIATIGSHQATMLGSYAAFMVKFDTIGKRKWGSYYGGGGEDFGEDITIDINEDLILTGNSNSTWGIATSAVHQSTLNGRSDAFIAKFDKKGKRQWGSYFGGSAEDRSRAISCDKSGNIIIAGMTESSSQIATSGAHETIYSGKRDAFLAKFDSTGQQLWGSYFGGVNEDYAHGIVNDSSGKVWIVGETYSSSSISTSGVHQPNYGGGKNDGFIAKFLGCEPNFDTLSVYACGEYDFNGRILNQAGIFHDTITNMMGCDSFITLYLYFHPFPVVQFSVNDTAQCLSNNLFNFTNQSSISRGTLTYQWLFGDLDSSDQFSPSYSFLQDDTIKVKLYAISKDACIDSIEKEIVVYPQPHAKFSIYDSLQCFERNAFALTNQSDITYGNMNFLWDFGDGFSSVLPNPIHSYSYDDTFFVKLMVNSDFGCFDSSNGLAYVINASQPISAFEILDTAQCRLNNTFDFTNLGSIQSGTLSSFWDFGDTDTLLSFHAQHTYNLADTFPVKLLLISDLGCKDSSIQAVYVWPMPQAGFTINNPFQCLAGNQFEFTDTTFIQWGNLSRNWAFGDGGFDINDTVVHSFKLADSFEVKLISISDFSCLDSCHQIIWVYSNPLADFAINDTIQCLSDNLFEFNNKTKSDVNPAFYWDFGDQNSDTSMNCSHHFVKADTFRVTLVSSIGMDCIDTVSHNVIVLLMPKADFTISDSSQCFNEQFFVIHDSSLASGDSISNYAWYLESLFLSKQQIDTLPNLQAGTWNLKLITRTTQHCTDSITKQITVHPSPITKFSINDSTQCFDSNEFEFTNLTTIDTGTLNYQWIIANDTLTLEHLETITFKKWGKYPIQLIASSDQNCSDTANQNIYVYPMPVAAFIYLNNCVEDTMWFYDSSLVDSGNITQWFWDFKNGNTSANQNPWTIYYDTGQKSVTLISTSDFGCASDTTQYFTLESKVSAPIIERATVENDEHILVEWKKPDEGIPKSYHLERSDDGNWWDYLSEEDQSIFSFEDYMVYPDIQSYYYRLSVTDSCDYTGEYSNNGKSILLQVDTSEAYPKLVWSAYEEWAQGVAGYAVQVAGSSSLVTRDLVYQRVTSNEQLVSSFTDSLTKLNSVYYCYRVIAYRNYDSLQSVSNIVCIPTELRLFVPNSFTPNGDGINDIFLPKGIFVSEYNLQIFNRWGEKLFESDDLNKGWDGSFKNKVCQLGTYYYQIRGKGANGKSEVHNGTVQLLK